MDRVASPFSGVGRLYYRKCHKDSLACILSKVYQVLADEKAEKHGLLRIIDESGEDYLYLASYFFFIDVPQKVERALRQSVSAAA